MMDVHQLSDLKVEIVEGKSNLANLEGRKAQLLETLQKEYGVKTIPSAEKKVKELQKQIEELDADIQTTTEKLEEQLPSGGPEESL